MKFFEGLLTLLTLILYFGMPFLMAFVVYQAYGWLAIFPFLFGVGMIIGTYLDKDNGDCCY